MKAIIDECDKLTKEDIIRAYNYLNRNSKDRRDIRIPCSKEEYIELLKRYDKVFVYLHYVIFDNIENTNNNIQQSGWYNKFRK